MCDFAFLKKVCIYTYIFQTVECTSASTHPPTRGTSFPLQPLQPDKEKRMFHRIQIFSSRSPRETSQTNHGGSTHSFFFFLSFLSPPLVVLSGARHRQLCPYWMKRFKGCCPSHPSPSPGVSPDGCDLCGTVSPLFIYFASSTVTAFLMN